MSHATLIYPHQLYAKHPALALKRPIFLVEEPLFFSEFPTHRQKLLLHRLSMQAYATHLRSDGYQVTLVPLTTHATTNSIFAWLHAHHFTHVHIVDTTDDWLESRITAACTQHHITRISYESPLFLLPKAKAIDRYQQSGRRMVGFYEALRRDQQILMENDGSPTGGRFSFDQDNRRRLPKDLPLPTDLTPYENEDIHAAKEWLATLPGEHYGEPYVWLPYTHETARLRLHEFITQQLTDFGPYEDAISSTRTRLFHSALSPLMNIGLLTPQEVIDAALSRHATHPVPLASLEGFIRQILGWREFIRAAYEVDGRVMRTRNFWGHTRPLPRGFWDGTTSIPPLDTSIHGALRYGYTHHIERLMVLGNFLLLTETHPDQVYRWFMAMYVDAYDWVMVPNVYGMSQFADGGSFATKPYISSSNYLRTMSDYNKGEWCTLWDALYWYFIHTHQDYFKSNHRLSMMPRLLAKMDDTKRSSHLARAVAYLQSLA